MPVRKNFFIVKAYLKIKGKAIEKRREKRQLNREFLLFFFG